MYTDVYKIADHVIKVSSMHQEVRKLCRDYLCEEKAEYEIVISQTDIEYERKKVQNDKKYMTYVHIWCDFLPARRIIFRVRDKIKRIIKNVKRQQSHA